MKNGKDKDRDIDFEIAFYESLLARCPGFWQALEALGEAYTRKGMYDRGLAADLRLLALRPLDEFAHYNLACDYSLMQDRNRSLRALEKAIVLGYRDFRHMEKDGDLAFVREDPAFHALLRKYRGTGRRRSRTRLRTLGSG